MNNQFLAQLEQLNLGSNEAKVYLALLEIGQTSAGAIIKKTGLHRSVVYETLDKLIARKLVFSLEKQNISFYQAKDPKKLEDMAQANLELAKSLVPSLDQILKAKGPEITVYEGVEEWRRFWMEKTATQPVGSIDYVAGSMGAKWLEYAGPMAKKWLKMRVERKIKWQMIVFHKNEVELEYLEKHPDLHSYRLISKDMMAEGNFNIWGDMLILQSSAEPMLIEIKNDILVRVFKNIFDLLWESAEPIS
jgi:sugar-specific transcriptional regulator TrmB